MPEKLQIEIIKAGAERCGHSRCCAPRRILSALG
jgi:hypothetical protein